jgi:adenylate cyclase
VLYGLWVFHTVRGELRTAQALAKECLQIAKQMSEKGALVEAHFAVGTTSLWRGEFAHAHATYEQGVADYQSQQHQALIALYGGYDPGVTCLCHAALALWFLGYPEQALRRSHEALRLAQDLGHLLSWRFL